MPSSKPRKPSNPAPRRSQASALATTSSPPDVLTSTQTIARMVVAKGNSLYALQLPTSQEKASPFDALPFLAPDTTTSAKAENLPQPVLAELPSHLRGAVLLKRNGFVVLDVDREMLGGRENKIAGVIVGVVTNEGKVGKEWR